MRRLTSYFIVAAIFISACSQKPYYKTAEGKRKLKYYNAVQFGQKDVPKPKF